MFLLWLWGLQLEGEQCPCHIVFDLVHHIVEALRPFLLIGHDRVLLAISTQADAILEILHLEKILSPCTVDSTQEEVVLDLVHDILSVSVVLLAVDSLGTVLNRGGERLFGVTAFDKVCQLFKRHLHGAAKASRTRSLYTLPMLTSSA